MWGRRGEEEGREGGVQTGGTEARVRCVGGEFNGQSVLFADIVGLRLPMSAPGLRVAGRRFFFMKLFSPSFSSTSWTRPERLAFCLCMEATVTSLSSICISEIMASQ